MRNISLDLFASEQLRLLPQVNAALCVVHETVDGLPLFATLGLKPIGQSLRRQRLLGRTPRLRVSIGVVSSRRIVVG